MSSMEKRYEIVPQMREYDRMGVEWMPYLMFFHPPGYVSPVVNTDERGFRVSYKGEEKITTPLQSADSSANLIVG
ncbi:MAG: SGNH/GDSL hydrolase family protein, partial [bacterium]|nr:SGNH/GDSL hydrolase family protein [bacterium]